MYVKSRNMLKLRKTELKSEKGKVCECSKSDTKIGIVPCKRSGLEDRVRVFTYVC